MTDQESTYPIAMRHRVGPKKGIFEFVKSRLGDVPDRRGDYAVVMEIDGHFEQIPDGTPIARADGIREADALVFVDIGSVYIDINLELKCEGIVDNRIVQVRFETQVIAPERVLQHRVGSVEARLENWVRRIVGPASREYPLEEWGAFEDDARARVEGSLHADSPLSPAAFDLSLVDLVVDLPPDVLSHEREMLARERKTAAKEHERRDRHVLEDQDRMLQHEIALKAQADEEDLWHAGSSLRGSKKDVEEDEARRLEEAAQRGTESVLARMAARNPEAIGELVEEIQRKQLLQIEAVLAALDRTSDNDKIRGATKEGLLGKLLEASGVDIGLGGSISQLETGRKRVLRPAESGGSTEEAPIDVAHTVDDGVESTLDQSGADAESTADIGRLLDDDESLLGLLDDDSNIDLTDGLARRANEKASVSEHEQAAES